MKFTGSALLWLAFLITGIHYYKRYSLRCAVYNELVIMCDGIYNRISYMKQPLEDIMLELCDENTCKNLTFLYLLKKNLNYDDFPTAWKKSVDTCVLPLNDKERCTLNSLAASLGKADGDIQLNIIGYYSEIYRSCANDAKRKREKYANATLLGWCLCGSAFMILFI